MCYMDIGARVGVRELRQNLSVYLERIARGETLEVTDRGRAVAILAPIRHEGSALDRLAAAGLVIPPTGDLLDLPLPRRAPAGFDPAKALDEQRADRRL
jgi:prevent-host-death family protein